MPSWGIFVGGHPADAIIGGQPIDPGTETPVGSTHTRTVTDVLAATDQLQSTLTTTSVVHERTVADTLRVLDPNSLLTSAQLATDEPLTVLRSRNRLSAKTGSFPPVARYVESGRKLLIIRNIDPGGRDVEVAYTTQHNGQGNTPTTGWVTIPAGQQFVDTSTTGRKVFCRSLGPGSALVDVYSEVSL